RGGQLRSAATLIVIRDSTTRVSTDGGKSARSSPLLRSRTRSQVSAPQAAKARSAAGLGSQCTKGTSVCVSSGNQRFGVERKTRGATRHNSATKRLCSSGPPTCSTTAFENETSNASSSNGRSVPLAVTVLVSGNSRAKFGNGTSLTAVIRSGHG